MANVTLRQIAEQLGCTRATVSYALKNSPNVSKEMRRKVQELALELGWKPDARLAKQMSLVRGTVSQRDLPKLAIVINKSLEELKREKAHREILEGARDYAREKGYCADIFLLPEEPMRALRFRSILEARGMEGIIYVGTIDPEIPLGFLEAGLGFACAVTGMRSPGVPYHVVMPDFLACGRRLVEGLKERGLGRPAIVIPKGLEAALAYSFTGGLASGLVELQECDQLRILYVGETETRLPEYEWDRMGVWLTRNRPDSVVTTDVEGFHRAVECLEGELAKLPVFSLDWFPGQAAAGGIDLRQRKIGEAAVDLVVAQIHRREVGVPGVQRSLTLEGIWKEGAALGSDPPVAAAGVTQR